MQQLQVMVVDDTSVSRALLTDGLDQIGLKSVKVAKDGEEALKMMMTSPCHLVISDYNMPKIDGMQL
ncbi:MAG: response regulator, partial [Hyphomicrobium sp.]